MSVNTDADPATLRNAMVDRLTNELATTSGLLLDPRVDAAMRQVERHRYVPDFPLETAYADTAVITHPSPEGAPLHLSCASVPAVVAAMLHALNVRPGQRILEIGAGTGYNAALLATLTGPDGEVTTVDINNDVTANARRNLDNTGFPEVRVLTRDGALGAREHAPYDRIIVTVGASDIPLTWWQQLTDDGRLVLPLRWRATTRALALTKAGGDHWNSSWDFLCGFVPMIGQPNEQTITIDSDDLVKLHYDADQTVDAQQLNGVLSSERAEHWSAEMAHGEEPLDEVWQRLTSTDPRTVRIEADPRAVTEALCTPAIPVRSPALVDGGSLAYFAIRRAPKQPGRWQLGAIGHGPLGAQLAAAIGEGITAWGPQRTAGVQVQVYPRHLGQPPADSGMAVPRPETIVVVTM
ncbi:methyltransferase, FxLD system [Kineosporia succinea]|uniref:Protein-L-isoaspartate O-methyltransferase n=1 Tax=Kineosporia succinea TaxID=84632 RepID=A0ABT9PA93_9ACTN|nr:methyltransferase, FxLD system [Kineosporia succinea]MDP9829593.1 protein-L-isoaspartate(D-aspartate) O-methyltransferase [Kineosporia succinea]